MMQTNTPEEIIVKITHSNEVVSTVNELVSSRRKVLNKYMVALSVVALIVLFTYFSNFSWKYFIRWFSALVISLTGTLLCFFIEFLFYLRSVYRKYIINFNVFKKYTIDKNYTSSFLKAILLASILQIRIIQ